MSERKRVIITGATGNVGTFAALALSRLGIADDIYIASRNIVKINDVFYNSQVNSLLRGHNTILHAIELNIENHNQVADVFGNIQPTIVLNCAAGLSLYPFFPALRARQKRIGFIPGFAHTLPKDMILLHPLMKGIKEASPESFVVNLAAPDISSYILAPLNLSPDIGAGTLDSTVQGVRLKISASLEVPPASVDVRMAAHHALRRYPASQVPFAIQIFVDGTDITDRYSQNDIYNMIDFATDTTGVETEHSPVSSNSAVTAASGVETTFAVLSSETIVRHGSGIDGTPGAMPVKINGKSIVGAPPNGLSMADTLDINMIGMRMDGLDRVMQDGTVVFTDKEHEWIREGLHLDWDKHFKLSNAKLQCDELIDAYKKMREEESL